MADILVLNLSTFKPSLFHEDFILSDYAIEYRHNEKDALSILQEGKTNSFIIYSPIISSKIVRFIKKVRSIFAYGKLSIFVIGQYKNEKQVDTLFELEINNLIDIHSPPKLIQYKLQEGIIQFYNYNNLHNIFNSVVEQNKQFQKVIQETNKFINVQRNVINESNDFQKNYKQLFDYMPVPLAYININNGEVLGINHKFTAVFGYDLRDGNNLNNWWQLAFPNKRIRNKSIKKWTQAVKIALLNNSEVEPEIYKITTKEKKELTVEISGRIVHNYIIASFIDLTEKENIKNQLKENKLLLSQIIESIPDPLFIKDADHKWTMVNESFSEFLGIPKENLIGKSDHDLFTEEEALNFLNSDKLVFEHGKLVIDNQNITLKNKNKRFISTKKALVKSDSEDGKNLVGIMRDITDFEKARLVVYESEKKFRTIFENIQEVYIEVELDGKITEVSPSIQHFSSYRREDLLGKYDEDYFIIKGKGEEIRDEILKRKRLNDYEIEVLNKDGSKLLCLATSVLVFDELKNPIKIISSLRNISDRKKAEQALKDSQLLLNEKSHQLNKGINYAQYIQNTLLPDHENFRHMSFDYYTYYKPKDMVGGDFYYIESINNMLFVAVADCTGHGVSGALLNVLGKAYLDEIIKHYHVTEPHLILNYLRVKIKESLQSTSDLSDGMDIGLCVINWQTNTMLYSGANIPLYLCSKESSSDLYSLTKYRPNRLPIGKHPNDHQSFTCSIIQLKHNDLIYLATDGFKAQFGGKHNETLKVRRFETLLSRVSNDHLHNQKMHLDSFFNEWKGSNQQVDDLLILGLRIKSKEEIENTIKEILADTEKFQLPLDNFLLDAQHKELFLIFDKIYKAYKEEPDSLDCKEITLQLKTFATDHFKAEEKYFSTKEFFKNDLHIKEHQYFKNFISDLDASCYDKAEDFSFVVLCFLKDWIVKHILGTDQKCKEYFNSQNN